MREYTCVLEVKSGGQWAPSAPITVRGGDGDSPRDAGLDWVAERRPGGDDWRLRVWPGDRVSLADAPAATLRPSDLAAVKDGPYIPVQRGSRPRHRVRMSGPASEVAERRRVDEVQPGDRIMVTDDRHNSAAVECTGPWWPAADLSRATEATVRESRVHIGGPRDGLVDLVTSVGELRGMRGDRSVALA